MKKTIIILAAAIIAVLVAFSLPTIASAGDCHGCGPSKSKFQ